MLRVAAACPIRLDTMSDPCCLGCAEPDVEVQIPADLRQRYVIDSLAAYVLRDGTDIEQAVMTREHANAEFAFLFNLTSPEHIYYR